MRAESRDKADDAAGISFGLAQLVATVASVQHPDFVPTAGQVLGIYAAILVSHGVINSIGIGLLKYFNRLSVLLHSVGIFAVAVALLAKAPTHLPSSVVWGTERRPAARPR